MTDRASNKEVCATADAATNSNAETDTEEWAGTGEECRTIG
jgi:hypothetical protein